MHLSSRKAMCWRFVFIPAGIILLLISCEQKTADKGMTLNFHADSVLNDTAPINYIVDSLKREFRAADSDTIRINILNELSQQHRVAANILCNEALQQSQNIGYKYGYGDALCRKGIVFYRVAEYDSAMACFESGRKLGEEIHSDKLIAQATAWIGDVYRMLGEPEKAIDHLERARKIAEECGAKNTVAFCLSAMGSMYYISGEYEKSIEFTNRAFLVAAEINDKFRMGFCLSSLGKVYSLQGNYSAAISSFSQALELARQVGNKTLISFCLNSIGDIYRQQDDIAQAKEYFTQALDMAREIGDKGRTAYALAYLGDIAREENKSDSAIDYYRLGIPIAFAAEDTSNAAYAYNGIGDAFRQKGMIDSAIYYFKYSLSLCDSAVGDEQQANNMIMLGHAYLLQKDYGAALIWAERGFAGSKEIGIPEYERDASEILYNIYKETGKPAEALAMHEYYMMMNDSIVNVGNVKKFEEEEYRAKENQLKAQQEEREAVMQNEKLRKERELEKQKYISYSASGGGVLALICLVIAIRGYRNKRKANEAIRQQKEQVEFQKAIIEEKNKEIVDSINYAQRIQSAIFPPEKQIKDVFGECFILYLPKDIVSGDFYWMEKKADGTAFLAAVDCTGHGVPGALVSVVGHNALNRAVREFGITDPGKILDKLNELVAETFSQSESEVKDGMDLSLLSLSEQNGTYELKWAGANNNLWHVRNSQLTELRADRQPIGKHEQHLTFTTHSVSLLPGDTVYIFTDGYADQFGGEKGKKFKYKSLQELIMRIQHLPASEQKENLHQVFIDWKGNLEQVDDVLVIGIKIH